MWTKYIDDIIERGDVIPVCVTYWVRTGNGRLMGLANPEDAMRRAGKRPYVLLDSDNCVWRFGETLLVCLQKALETQSEDMKRLHEEFVEGYSFMDWGFYPTTFTAYERIGYYWKMMKNPWEWMYCMLLDGYAELSSVSLDDENHHYEAMMEEEEGWKKAAAFLTKKGFPCKKYASCHGCEAFDPWTKKEILGDDPDMSFTEMWLNNYEMGECRLGYDMKWIDIGDAVPTQECPKPLTRYEYMCCRNLK